MYQEHRDFADFFVVYIAEAHPTDGWQMESNVAEGVLIRQAVQFDERLIAAKRCAAALGLTIPTLIDGMDDAAMKAFAAWPERIFVFDSDNRAHYCGGPGPFEFNPAEARAALTQIIDAPRSVKVRDR